MTAPLLEWKIKVILANHLQYKRCADFHWNHTIHCNWIWTIRNLSELNQNETFGKLYLTVYGRQLVLIFVLIFCFNLLFLFIFFLVGLRFRRTGGRCLRHNHYVSGRLWWLGWIWMGRIWPELWLGLRSIYWLHPIGRLSQPIWRLRLR